MQIKRTDGTICTTEKFKERGWMHRPTLFDSNGKMHFGIYYFRQYTADGECEDIEVFTEDMEVRVLVGSDCWLYVNPDGSKYLDYSPQTLGYEILED